MRIEKRLDSLKHYLKSGRVHVQNKHNRENQNCKKSVYVISIIWFCTKG